MPAIQRLHFYGQHARADRDRLPRVLSHFDPFYMGTMTGGRNVAPVFVSVGRINESDGFSYNFRQCNLAAVNGMEGIEYVVWSYDTPIAYWCSGCHTWAFNQHRYSRTTTNHQSHLLAALRATGEHVNTYN